MVDGRMTILVTGGAGTKGGICARALMDAGYDIMVYDNLSSGSAETVGSLDLRGSKGKLTAFINGDVRDREWTFSAIGSVGIEAVVHCATISSDDPGECHLTNIGGTINVLDAMRIHGIKGIVMPCIVRNAVHGSSIDMAYRILDDYEHAYGITSARILHHVTDNGMKCDMSLSDICVEAIGHLLSGGPTRTYGTMSQSHP
jgi:UDP-glucose 4-epimerase